MLSRKEYSIDVYRQLYLKKYKNIRTLVLKGSKYSGKSQQAAQMIIEHMLCDPYANAYVYMKNALDHDGKTKVELLKAIAMFEIKTKGKFKSADGEGYGQPNRRLVRKTTGQQIIFLSFDISKDNNKSSGRKPSMGYVSHIGLEEPESSNAISKPMTEDEAQQTIADGDTALLSVKRNEGKGKNAIIKEIITYNPYEASGGIDKKYGRKTTEDLEKLKRDGYDIEVDHDYENGNGKIVLTTNYRCNPFISDAVLASFRAIEENNPSLALTVCYGITASVKNAILENEVRKLTEKESEGLVDELYLKKCEKFTIGMDGGLKDSIAQVLTGVNTYFAENNFKKTIKTQEYVIGRIWEIKNPDKYDYDQKIDLALENTIKGYNEYIRPYFKQELLVYVDNSEPIVIDNLNARFRFMKAFNLNLLDVSIKFVKCRKWTKIGGLVLRMKVFKLLFAQKRFKFNKEDPNMPKLIQEMKKKTRNPKNGEISNTDDNIFNAKEYSGTSVVDPHKNFNMEVK